MNIVQTSSKSSCGVDIRISKLLAYSASDDEGRCISSCGFLCLLFSASWVEKERFILVHSNATGLATNRALIDVERCNIAILRSIGSWIIATAGPVEKFSMQLFVGLLLVGFTSYAHAWCSPSSLGFKDSVTYLRAHSRAHPSGHSCPTFLNTVMVSEQHARSSSIDRKTFLTALIGTSFPAMTMADSTGKFSSKVIRITWSIIFHDSLAPVARSCNYLSALFVPNATICPHYSFPTSSCFELWFDASKFSYWNSALPRIDMCPGFKRCAIESPV